MSKKKDAGQMEGKVSIQTVLHNEGELAPNPYEKESVSDFRRVGIVPFREGCEAQRAFMLSQGWLSSKQVKLMRQAIAEEVKDFLMGQYLVKSGDQYRLNRDDHSKLEKIITG